MRASFTFCCALLLIVTASVRAADPPRGMAAYLDGLDALEAARFEDAAGPLAKAVGEDGDNADFHVARGIAAALADKPKEAEEILTRARRLNERHPEVRLWLATAIAMQGRFSEDVNVFPAATRDPYENAVRSMSREYGSQAWVEQRNAKERRAADEQAAKERRDNERFGPRPNPAIDKLNREAQEHDRAQETAGADAEMKKAAAQRQAARAKFPELAAAFARRAKASTPDITPLLYDRARQRFAAKNYSGAMNDLQRVAAAQPTDVDVQAYVAWCHVYLGSPGVAREIFTRVLTARPASADAFYGRAMAAADMGDARRASADVDAAAKLRPADGDAMRAAVAQHARAAGAAIGGASPSKQAVAGMVADLQKQARAGAKDDELLKQAGVIHRAASAYRMRADETYIDRRRELTEAVEAEPNSAARLADLGEFLYRQAAMIRGESVEPRAEHHTYRPQTKESQKNELAQAEQALDAALGADPASVKAVTFKAACLMRRLQWADAETLLNKALAIDKTYPPLLEVFAQFLDHAAAMKASKAAGLRETKTWEDYHYYYWQRPSQADLALADEYDRQAERMWAMALEHLESAARLHAGKPDGFYYAGVVARRKGDAKAARTAFEECVKLAPDRVEAHDQLSAIYAQLGLVREAFEQQAAATNVTHTTAGPMLRYAWMQIVKTAWRASGDALNTAMLFDPTDPRVAAYLAVVAEGSGKPDEALAWYRTAAALEEARGAFDGRSYRAGGATAGGSTAAISAEDAALILTLNLRIGRLEAEVGRHDEAVATFKQNAAIAARIRRGNYYRALPASMLPDPKSDPQGVPQADHVMSLLAWSRLGAGQSLAALKSTDEAMREFEAAGLLQTQVPPTVDAGTLAREPIARATLARCRVLLEKPDMEAAAMVMRAFGRPWGLSKETEAERVRLSEQINSSRQQKAEDDYAKEFDKARRERDGAIEQEMQRRREADAARRAEVERIRKQQEEIDRRRREQQRK